MNEKQIEAALAALSEQMPRAPEKSIEDMVRTVNLLNKERQHRIGETSPAPVRRTQKQLSSGSPVKDKPKTL